MTRPNPNPRWHEVPGWNRIDLDDEVLIQLYCYERVSGEEIARRFGCKSSKPVYRRLRELGLTRNKSEAQIGINAGVNNPNWRGGRFQRHDGYVLVRLASGVYEFEHRVVAEKTIGRALLEGEVVHHINEDRSDNRPENLEVLPSQSEHMRLHMNSCEARKRGLQTQRSRAALAALAAKGGSDG